jgi:hypothetical protein
MTARDRRTSGVRAISKLGVCTPLKSEITGSTPGPTTTDDQAKCLVINGFPANGRGPER